MQQAARFFSYLFHPLFAPLLCVFILFQLPVYLNYKLNSSFFLFVYAVVVINLIVTPLLISMHLKRRGIIDSLTMPTAKQRVIPYLVSAIFYVFTYFLLVKVNFPVLYLSIFRASCAVVILLLIASFFNFKISAHLSGLGGIYGVLIVVSIVFNLDATFLLIVCTLIVGVVASSRLILKAHTNLELLAGFILGIGTQLSLLL